MLYGAFHEPKSTFKGPECNTFFKLKELQSMSILIQQVPRNV